ncbi:hypothetical protein [Kushneria indalinina]|uniref:AlpA family transcriptional regulator n=1 Tax=Kushneria indalinina DSM 14324 TaxID=1122140 RepID=A0A3D9DX88_9GAMM|nr:hypothetical protein [Kushneria indalinina]REC94914.1 hypothetical protein C8D72_1743 [Kushneria indalinina DSM 14324]
MNQSEILYTNDLAGLLGKTQVSITNAIQRESDMLPPGRFKIGRHWAWKRATVMRWLDDLEAGAPVATQKRKPGRPRITPAAPQASQG